MDDNSEEITAQLKSLDRRVWISRGSRFNTSRRLNLLNNLSIWTISILTVCIIALSLLTFNCELNTDKNVISLINTLNIVFSVFVFGLSYHVNLMNYKSDAEKIHNNAKKMPLVQNKIALLKIQSSISVEELTDVQSEYNKIIDECDINHKNIDYEKFKLQEWKKNKDKSEFSKDHLSAIEIFRRSLSDTGLYYFLIIGSICVCVLFYYNVYK